MYQPLHDAIKRIEKVAGALDIKSRGARYVLSRCPHRRDRNPSFSIFVGKDGNILVSDMAGGWTMSVDRYLYHFYGIKPKRVVRRRSANNPRISPLSVFPTRSFREARPIKENSKLIATILAKTGIDIRTVDDLNVKFKDESLESTAVFLLSNIHNPYKPPVAAAIRYGHRSWETLGPGGPAFYIPTLPKEPGLVKRAVIVEGLRNAYVAALLLPLAWKREDYIVIGLHGATRHLEHLAALTHIFPNLKRATLLTDNDTSQSVAKRIQFAIAPIPIYHQTFTTAGLISRYVVASDEDDLTSIAQKIIARYRKNKPLEVPVPRKDKIHEYRRFLTANRLYGLKIPKELTTRRPVGVRTALRIYMSSLLYRRKARTYPNQIARAYTTNARLILDTSRLTHTETELLTGLLRLNAKLDPGGNLIIKTTITAIELNTQLSRAAIFKTLKTLSSKGLAQRTHGTLIIRLPKLRDYSKNPPHKLFPYLVSVNGPRTETLKYRDWIIRAFMRSGISYRNIRVLFNTSLETIWKVGKQGLMDRSNMAPRGYTYMTRAVSIVERRLREWERLINLAMAGEAWAARVIVRYHKFREEVGWKRWLSDIYGISGSSP